MVWDSSGLIPYLVPENLSKEVTDLLSGDRAPVIWWATPVECVSALERGRREGRVEIEVYEEARRRLREIVEQSAVVQAHPIVRERAERLLATHPLRAADALQLAAALVAVDDRPAGEELLSLDERLREAARKEGFRVLPETA